MTQTYYAILTAVGEAKLANATVLGTPVQISRMAVGDGNGSLPTPNRTQTALINERYRADLNTLSADPLNVGQIIAELVIPETEGGYWLREFGLYDVDDNLIAVSNCPPSYKPQMAEGSGRTQVLRMVLVISSSTAVQLKIDPSVVLATRAWIEVNFLKLGDNPQPGQVPTRTATGMEWKYPYQQNGEFKPSASNFTAKKSHAYFLAASIIVILPAASGLIAGDAVRFIKKQSATPIIQVDGAAGELIQTTKGTDTAVTFDINSEIVMVFNGTAWEV
jgi:hypothetical protein